MTAFCPVQRITSAALVVAGAMTALPAGAASPACCRLFEFDATPILGRDPAICGKIPDADTPEETVDERRSATRCALAAQTQGRAFVYTYRELIPPDIDLIVQAVFGVRGEQVLLKAGRFARQDVHTAEICARLTVMSDGKLVGEGCENAQGYIDSMRITPW